MEEQGHPCWFGDVEASGSGLPAASGQLGPGAFCPVALSGLSVVSLLMFCKSCSEDSDPRHCVLSLMSPKSACLPVGPSGSAEPSGGSCFSAPKSFSASMLSILQWEGWQAGIPLGFPGMQGGSGGGLEMSPPVLRLCISATPWHGDGDSARAESMGRHADLRMSCLPNSDADRCGGGLAGPAGAWQAGCSGREGPAPAEEVSEPPARKCPS